MMVISDEHKFIFLAIPKTGSSSIQWILEKFGWRTPQTVYAAHLFPEAVIRHPMIGIEKWNAYTKIGFVGNPWDRYVSCFLSSNILRTNWNKNAENTVLSLWSSFEEYIRSGGYEGMHQVDFLFYPKYPDSKRKEALDFVGRFENFEKDVVSLLEKLNLPVPSPIPHANKSPSREGKLYTEYYTEQWMIDAVSEREEFVINKFGYRYGENG